MEQISVNLIPSGIKGTCHASQFDIGRSIRFALLSGSNIYTLSGSETITMKIRKPDGTERTETLANTSSTYVDLVTNRDTCDQSGTYDCEITVTDGGVVIGSGNFTMEVEADSLDGIIVVKTASGAIASFSTSLPFPLNEAKFTLPYKAGGYTELKHYNSKTTPVFDLAPYLTRANTNTGNLALEKLVGLTVCFNQLVQNGNFESTSGWTAQNGTINGASNNELDVSYLGNGEFGQNVFCGLGFTPEESHVYFTTVDVKLPTTSGEIGLLGGSQLSLVETKATTNWQTLSAIFKGNTYSYFIIRNRTSNVALNNVKLRNAMLIDLTAMFGSEVADYLYTLESGTAGAGVSAFKSLFGADYYPYTANTLMSAKPTGKVIKDENDQTIETIVYSGNELRGLIKVGTDGLFADGDIDDGSGSTDIKFGEENTDNVTFLYNVDNNWLSGELPNCDQNIDWNPEAISDLPYTLVNSNVLSSNDKSWTLYGGKLFIRDTTKTENELRSIIADKKIVYLRQSPTTATSAAWSNPIVAKEGGTETFVDNRTIALPCGHDTIYGTDMVVKTADFGQTVFGGDYEAVSGAITSRYNSDGSTKTTPDIIQIAPEVIMAMAGNNNVWNEAGNSEVKYVDLKGEET